MSCEHMTLVMRAYAFQVITMYNEEAGVFASNCIKL